MIDIMDVMHLAIGKLVTFLNRNTNMKIDIHVHTKKCKEGDSEYRNIDADRFDQIIRLTDVRILAITNHNHFDLIQYQQIADKVKDVCLIWPGIELDVLEDGRKSHLIVIVNPKNAEMFSREVNCLLQSKSADNFTISLEHTVNHFDNLDAVYIAHYQSKKPNLLNEDVIKLMSLVRNEKRVLKEVTNSISAGIYISHGHNSIYGTDVHNWDDYHIISKDLPELRLPVESFEQFCLLLEKDNATIKTILDKKKKETIQLNVFGVAELVDLVIYNDINILFGSKGTGKTEILRAISKHYNGLGFKNEVYESNSKRLEDVYDIKGSYYDEDVESFGFDNCTEEIKRLRGASEKNVTSLSTYSRYFSAEETNRKSKNLKIKNLAEQDESYSKRAFDNITSTYSKFDAFSTYISSEEQLLEIVGEDLLNELMKILKRIIDKLKSESKSKFIDFRSVSFYNQIIQTFVHEISKKTGQPQKPTTTGFREYASNRIKIERDIRKIINNLTKSIKPNSEYVGNLGEKGHLYCQTNLKIHDGSFVDGNFQPVKKVTKNPQKNVANKLRLISKQLYSNSLFEKITEFKQVDGSETINSISDLLLFYRYFTIDNQYYSPSSGESSMVLLHNELMQEKEIYLIDEPERSLGNDYISDVIVPILRQRAQSGKKVIIVTHDANIAVRTLPYNSIYREHDATGYYTYLGNPFSNTLKCTIESKNDINWKEISMKRLEGGKEAFGERGKIYGNT